MDREAWHAAIHGAEKSWTWLSDWTELNWMTNYVLYIFLYVYWPLLYILWKKSLCPSLNLVVLLFFKAILTIQGPFRFQMNFRMDLSISAKNYIGILIRIALNLQIALGSTDILKALLFPVHGHRIFFNLFVSSSVFSLLYCSFQCTCLFF